MRKSLRRAVAGLLIAPFLFSLYPQKESAAFLPAAIPVGVALLDAAGSVTVADAAATGLVTLLGAVGMAAILYGPSDTGNAQGQVRVPLSTAAGSATAIIPPAAPSTAAAVRMWQYYCASGCGWSGSGYVYASEQAAADGFCVRMNHGTTGTIRPGDHPACDGGGYYNDSLFYLQYQDQCPAGYSTPVSGTCTVLTNARAAVADKKADFQRSGTTLSQYAGDDQGPSVKPLVSTTTNTNDTVSVSGQDAAGNPRRISVQATADNGSKIQVQTQMKDANANTYVTNQTITISPSGSATSVTTAPLAQALTLDPTTGQYTPTTGTAATATPSLSINFPTDYARDATVTSAATQAHTDSGKLHDDLLKVEGVTAPSDPTVKSTDDVKGTLLDSSFSGLKSWTLPARSVSCPTGTFSVWGSSYTIDAHCTLWAGVSSTIQAVMLLSWSLLAMFIVLGA